MSQRVWSEATACGHLAGAQAVGGPIAGALVSCWVIEWAATSQTFRGLYLPTKIAA